MGEIRDLETAQIAVQASLTGHLVFSTLHTNDAPSAPSPGCWTWGWSRSWSPPPSKAIVAQRLVRKICLDCKEEYHPTEEQLMELGLTPEEVTGQEFFSRQGLRVLQQDRATAAGWGSTRSCCWTTTCESMIMQARQHPGPPQAKARNEACGRLRQSGLLAIYDGITTIEEVVRETIMEEE